MGGDKLLSVYGHVELIALGEIDALYRDNPSLRAVLPDANPPRGAAEAAS